MTTNNERDAEMSDEERAQIARMLAENRCPFGPQFFLTQLSAFVRERCPDPDELPRVDLWIEGEPRTVCHVITIAPRWLALAVWNGRGEHATMSTEIVPYETISRVTIGGSSRTHGIGFQQLHAPMVIDGALSSPETTLERLATPHMQAARRSRT
jgi:hypothetical protein